MFFYSNPLNPCFCRPFPSQGSCRDLGADEFPGSSLNVVPPQIVDINPAVILGGDTKAIIIAMDIAFSKEATPIDGLAIANYELPEAGWQRHLRGR